MTHKVLCNIVYMDWYACATDSLFCNLLLYSWIVIVKSNIIIFLIPRSRQHTLQIGDKDKSMTAALGHFSEFQPQREKVSDYLERVSLYFKANGVAEDKQVAVLLTAIGGETYTLVTSMLSPMTRVMKK